MTSNIGGFIGTSSGSPITITGLTNGVSYTFTVIATNALGDSVASSVSNAVTPATTPNAPSITGVTRGNGQATITFTAPGNTGGSAITYYTITSSGGQTVTGTSSPLIITGLTNGTSYTFTITATNDVGTSTSSAQSSAVTPAAAPNAPTNVQAVRGNGQATITFDAPADNGSAITQYTVTSSGGQTATGASSGITIS